MADCSQFGAGHLDSWLSAYVDEELSASDSERVESHLLVCDACAQSVAEIEEVRHVLALPAISASEGLMDRLRHIEHTQVPVSVSDDGGSDKKKWRQRVLMSMVGLAASTVVLALIGASSMPDVRGTAAEITQDRWFNSATSYSAADHERAATQRLEVPFSSRSNIELLDVAYDSDRQETEAVLLVEDSRALMRQGRGKLLPGDRAPGQVQRVNGHEIHVVHGEPWTAIWQCGDTVVTVAADASPDVIETLVEAFPPHPYDEGIPAHVARGMYTLRTAIGKKAP